MCSCLSSWDACTLQKETRNALQVQVFLCEGVVFSSPRTWVVGPCHVYVYGWIQARFENISSLSSKCACAPSFLPSRPGLLSLRWNVLSSAPHLASARPSLGFLVCDVQWGPQGCHCFRGLCHPNSTLIFPTAAPSTHWWAHSCDSVFHRERMFPFPF